MSKIADALQHRLVSNLSAVNGKHPITALSDLLIAPRASFNLSIDNTSNSFSVDFRDTEPVLSGLAGDCTRFCIAAYQTIEKISAGDKDSFPWDLIKLYYSAFYSGHLVLRLLGTPCSFLDVRHTTAIQTLATAIGSTINFPLAPGMFKCEIARPATSMTFSRLTGRQSSTHDQFWKVFSAQLNLYSQEILSGPMSPEDSQAVFACIESFRTMLRSHGAESWLSSVRNEIQYRHSYGVWFPCTLRKPARNQIMRKMARLYRDPMGFSFSSDALDDFASGCAFVIGLAHTLLRRTVELGNSKQIFLAYATERFCVRL